MTTSDTQLGLPGYTELRELGRGTQGRVVLARSNSDSGDTAVAIKYLASWLLSDKSQRAAFRREAELLSQLHHPNLARIHEYVETGQHAAIVMDVVEGISLKELLPREGTLTPESALAVLKGSLLGLQAAHSMNVVHRDYKPANVMVEENGTSKLIDFGVAGLAGAKSLGGTPAYMAPEQWRGATTPATDVYAATCVFFECVTGRQPYEGMSKTELAALHMHAPIPLDGVPAELHDLINQGMAKDASDRPPMAQDFVAELEVVASDAYGPDWELRGLIALGTAVGALAALFSIALAASTLGSSTLTGTGLAQGSTALGQPAGKTLLAKVGGAKGASGITIGTASVVIAAVLLWPAAPKVGGEAHGSYRATFSRPGALIGQPYMPASETPFMEVGITVVPARVRPGTKMRVTLTFHAKSPRGGKYLPDGSRQCFGENPPASSGTRGSYNFTLGNNPQGSTKDRGFVWFYRTRTTKGVALPTGSGIYVSASNKTTNDHQPYVFANCAYDSSWITVQEFSLPDTDELPPGHYQLSAVTGPPQISSVSRNKKKLPLESVGPKVEGALPIITILK